MEKLEKVQHAVDFMCDHDVPVHVQMQVTFRPLLHTPLLPLSCCSPERKTMQYAFIDSPPSPLYYHRTPEKARPVSF